MCVCVFRLLIYHLFFSSCHLTNDNSSFLSCLFLDATVFLHFSYYSKKQEKKKATTGRTRSKGKGLSRYDLSVRFWVGFSMGINAAFVA